MAGALRRSRWCVPALLTVLLVQCFATSGFGHVSGPEATSSDAASPAEAPRQREGNQAFYVSPSGDDGNAGDLASPFRTLERARDVVRTVNGNMAGDIQVYLRGGTYRLASTFSLSSIDSGTNGYRVRYLAYPGETPVVSGGLAVTGWVPASPGTWKATPPSLDFRQLYVDGEPATRARSPDALQFYKLTGWDEGGKRLEVPSGLYAPWARLNEVEMHVQKHWIGDIFRIESVQVSGGSAFIAPMQPERDRSFLMDCGAQRDTPQAFHFENAYEFLDAPGEWYLNRTTSELFYRPRPGEDMAQAEVTIPAIERLVEVVGTVNDPVHHVSFEGITFTGSNWVFPSAEGFVGLQATVHVTSAGPCSTLSAWMMPFAFFVAGAHNLSFSYNTFRGLGASGLALHEASSDITISANVFGEIAGNAIAVGTALQSNPADPRLVCARDIVSDNFVSAAGRWYPGGVGIFTGYVREALIEHNELVRVPYTAISVGWGWTSSDTALRDNVVRHNNIHGAMLMHDDGAGIYTLSKQPGTLIAENFIHDIVRSPDAGAWPIAGVYLDQGSSQITVRDNSMVEVPKVIHENVASGNTFVNNGGLIQSVIDNAGIRPAFRWIRPAPDPLRVGPAAQWSADADRWAGSELRDSESRDLDGIVRGGSRVAGIIGDAISFDGVEDHARVVDDLRLESENLTLTTWFKVGAFKMAGDTRDWLVNKNYHEWWDGHYSLVVNGGAQPQLGACMNIGGGSGAVKQAWSAPGTIAAGQWHFGALTYDGATLALHLDGVRVSQAAVGLLRSSGYGDFILGRRADSFAHFNGALDDVRFYNRALGDAEIASLHRRLPDAPEGLAANGSTTAINLSWSPPALNGGFPVTGYRLWRGTQPGIYNWNVSLGSVGTYSDTGAVPGQVYYYAVSAVNSVGEGPKSGEVSAQRGPSVPESVLGSFMASLAMIATLAVAAKMPAAAPCRRRR
jgi:hypothetical protein